MGDFSLPHISPAYRSIMMADKQSKSISSSRDYIGFCYEAAGKRELTDSGRRKKSPVFSYKGQAYYTLLTK